MSQLSICYAYRIPVVKFYGMGEDGLYSIHIVDGCVNKTSAFIERMMPGCKFHSVPWMKDESIQLLGCAGGPLHSRQRDTADEGMLDDFVVNPRGTIGGLANLLGRNERYNERQGEMYVLTANHVVEQLIPNVEYISWSNEDQSDKHVIGREVPYKIPLRMDSDSDEEDIDDWKDATCQKEDEKMLEKCVYHTVMNDKDEEEQQYDIACIKVDDQHDPACSKINNEQFGNIKHQYNDCNGCCNKERWVYTDPRAGSNVVKLGLSLNQAKGKILQVDAAGEIKVGNKTAWVENMVAISSETPDSDTAYTQPGDSGTIVCDTRTENWGHYLYCFMIFAGWDKANIYNAWNKPVSLAFSLPDALEKLVEQVPGNDDESKKKFKLSCCMRVFEQIQEEEEEKRQKEIAECPKEGAECLSGEVECSNQEAECSNQEVESSKEKGECSKEANCSKQKPECLKEEATCSKEKAECSKEETECSNEEKECLNEKEECSKEEATCSKEEATCSKEEATCSKEETECLNEKEECSKEEATYSKEEAECSKEETECLNEKEECSKEEATCSKQEAKCSKEEECPKETVNPKEE
ncbi:unnamed protein product [Owenia fusiformis]|uniref:Uncharacterized protein n=1 Tax=Owenia fusiformis TaxID=6347 RepID=A0A8J1UCX0_OWEFU|nr:unnamed protein product [Owenia fusiformis]